jgi:hypothetical protein
MYDTAAAMVENRSKEQKVNSTTQTNALTSPQEIALRNESPELRQSQAIVVIGIEFHVE